MSYSHSTISRVTEEFRAKPMRARSEASKRRAEIHAKFPEILKIDEELSDVGFKMYEIISSGRSEGEIKTALDELQKNNEELQKKRGPHLGAAFFCAVPLEPGTIGISERFRPGGAGASEAIPRPTGASGRRLASPSANPGGSST